MDESGETTLTIHGLDEDNRLVRAEVFAEKFQALMSGLKAADKYINGKRRFGYIITAMSISSAVVRVKERRVTKKPPLGSSIACYETSVRSIYQGDKSAESLPEKLVQSIANLSIGAQAQFAHAEVGDEDNVVRVDEYLHRQALRAKEAIQHAHAEARPRFFSGVAKSSFDGVLQLMDSRGTALLAKLTTTAGGKEIDCVVNKAKIPELRSYFEQRVRIEGVAHYDGEGALPVRLDVVAIKPVKKNADLTRWRGAFSVSPRNGGL